MALRTTMKQRDTLNKYRIAGDSCYNAVIGVSGLLGRSRSVGWQHSVMGRAVLETDGQTWRCERCHSQAVTRPLTFLSLSFPHLHSRANNTYVLDS